MSEHHDLASKFGTGHKTLSSYVWGLVLSSILTILAFGLVATHALPTAWIYISLAVLAVLQLFVQVTCFLRLNTATEDGRWNTMPFLFTIVVILVVVFGSLWIMYNLNYNMMH